MSMYEAGDWRQFYGLDEQQSIQSKEIYQMANLMLMTWGGIGNVQLRFYNQVLFNGTRSWKKRL